MKRDEISPDIARTVHTADPAQLPRLLEVFGQALKDDPDHVDALYGSGVACFRQGDPLGAIGFFERAHERIPDNLDVRRNLTGTYLTAGKFEDAYRMAEGLLEDTPDDIEVYRNLHWACRELGRAEELRRVREWMQAHCDRGYHYQPNTFAAFDGPRSGRIVDGGNATIGPGAVRTWHPLAVGQGGAELVGALQSPETAAACFLVCGDDGEEREIEAEVADNGGDGVSVYQAAVSDLTPGAAYRTRLSVATGDGESSGEWVTFVVPLDGPPQAAAEQATPIGTAGLTFNGAVGGSTLPTRFHFRYGTDPDNLEKTTPTRAVPPPRDRRVVENGANRYYRITAYSFGVGFRDAGSELDGTGPQSDEPVVMVLPSPFGKDRNHINGIGIVDLVLGWHSAIHVRDRVGGVYGGEVYPKKAYPGEMLDLRDAELSATLRSDDLDTRDFRLVAWFHAATGTALIPHHMEDAVPWALTGSLAGPTVVADGQWRTLTWRFRDNSADWSFAGNNIEEMGGQMGRYRYYPLGQSLSRNRGNLNLCFVCGRDIDTPDGVLELAALSLRCRSHSLLGPGFGSRIVAWPGGSLDDPAGLTGGWIGHAGHCWRSGPEPEAPQEFVWRFAGEAKIESVRVFQDPIWPSRRIEVLVSDDGGEFTEVWSAELQADAAGVVGTAPLDKPEPLNLASICILDEPFGCRFLKLRIVSGYRGERWGLDAIEAFGEGLSPLPEIESCSVSEDVIGIEPGATVHYRLVAENQAGMAESAVMTFDVPNRAVPIVQWGRVIGRDDRRATLLVRLTAMGTFADLDADIEDRSSGETRRQTIAVGRSETPRHATVTIDGLEADRGYAVKLTATNETGRSNEIEVEIDASGDLGNEDA